MSKQDEFQQAQSPEAEERGGLKAPPRLLLWSLIILFILGIIGIIGGIIVFRNVLQPAQQQRVIDQLPFMQSFLPPTPEGGAVPTIAPPTGGPSPLQLLQPINTPTPQVEQTPEATVQATEEVSIAASPTPLPTATPTSEPTEIALAPTATPEPQQSSVDAQPEAFPTSAPPRPAAYVLGGFTHQQQSWNNCGPATVTMALSYYGWTRDQEYAARIIRPEREDKNSSPSELVSFVNEETSVRALTRVGGDLEMIKQFIANDFPVIIERGHAFEGYDWIGHYQVIVGYDDSQRLFFIYDSFLGDGENGEGITEDYDFVDNGWRAFNRLFIVIYEPAREGLVRQILGNRADLTLAAQNALEVAQNEARANPQDAFAWFNIGSSRTLLGRYAMDAGDQQAAQENYAAAAAAYDQAWQFRPPWRITWYQFGPYEAYFQTQRYGDVLTLAETTIENSRGFVEEAFYWQGRVYAAQGNNTEAASAFRRVLRANPRFSAAQDALNALPG